MTPDAFIKRWRDSPLTERAASQSHFNDLCKLLGELSPTEADTTGDTFAFEKGAMKTTGGQGWADVWKKGCFAWEYKQPGKDLNAAFVQLQRYSVALENPPLLIVSDRERFRIHTNWTNTVAETHEIAVEDLRDANKRQLLKWAFSEPERLKPKKTRDELTAEAAGKFADLATRLRERGNEAQQVAHFVNRLVFCMFAEDVDLLPKKLFSKMLDAAQQEPEEFQSIASSLFKAMRKGGRVGFEAVEWFNGGLFDDDKALSLEAEEIKLIHKAADLDWAGIDPAIFGTLFERGLDPDKRSQLGAHYTDRDKIMMIVDPVIARPLNAEWNRIKSEIQESLGRADRKSTSLARAKAKANSAINGFLDKLKEFRVLDPACGSGNFLYLALQTLKDLEHKVNLEAEVLGFPRRFPEVGPQCVKGLEINPYAAELARVSIWIGEIQWMRRNGFDAARNPILKPLDAIECRDAIIEEESLEAEWPVVDAIVSNPPFLGSQAMLGALGYNYVEKLRNTYGDRVPGNADFVTYWFEKARHAVEHNRASRIGFVATQAVRRGGSSSVISRLAKVAPIFEAWSDEPWTIEGASVRVSVICFSSSQEVRKLDGKTVIAIPPTLSALEIPISDAVRLIENEGLAFQGPVKVGPFDVPGDIAREWLQAPRNPNGSKNCEVLHPLCNGADIAGRGLPDRWIIDFGPDRSAAEAAHFEAPFKHVSEYVKPQREKNRDVGRASRWWLHGRSGADMRSAIRPLRRYIATPRVSKHRLFVFLESSVFPDSRLVAIAREDYATFGILHSRIHELWALELGGWHGVGNDPQYTPSTGFETFPFPEGISLCTPASELERSVSAQAIAVAASRLDVLRASWLNPPDMVQRIPEVVPGYPDRLLPLNDKAAAILKKRTLTNLYNERPQWLADAHEALDVAVAAAYGWPSDLSDEDVLAKLFALNQERAAMGR